MVQEDRRYLTEGYYRPWAAEMYQFQQVKLKTSLYNQET